MSHTVTQSLRMEQRQEPRGRSRVSTYKAIAALLWQQFSAENDIVRVPFEQAPANVKGELLDHAEVLANMFLSPDLRDTALMCAADNIARSNYYGACTIAELPRPAQQSYLTTAERTLQNFFLNLRTVAPDARYREEMCRLTDAVVPKTPGVM